MSSVALADVVKIKGGGTPSKGNPTFYSGDIPWVTPKDMKVWEITDATDNITQEAIDKSATNLIPENAVLIVNRSGILKHTLPVGITRRPVAINQDIKALLCSDLVDPAYLAHLVKAAEPIVLTWVRATTADNFPIQNLAKLKIPLPPLAEQRRIAAILDQADALRRLRRRALDRLQSLGQSIFHEMFGEFSDTPKNRSRLGDLLTFVTSGGRGWAKFYCAEGARFIRSLDVQMNEIGNIDSVFVDPPKTAEAERTKIQPGDVLLTITGSKIGRAAAVPDSLAGSYISQHVSILRPDETRLSPEFLSFFLSSKNHGQMQIKAKQYGQAKPGLNFEQIRSFILPDFSISKQEQFASHLNEIRKIKVKLLDSNASSNFLFTSLQHRAFRGEL